MRKMSVILFSFLIATLISLSTISPARADINSFTWLPPYLYKSSTTVYYEHGSTVKLAVPIENNVYSKGLNVSKVIISFDWGQNKTLDLSASINQVTYDTIEVFTVSFTADATEAVSSDWRHDFTVYVEHVNATTGPTKIVGTWSRSRASAGAEYFVVCDAYEADAGRAYDELLPLITMARQNLTSARARVLLANAVSEMARGDSYYDSGRYSEANTTYHTALDLVDQALEAEEDRGSDLESAQMNYYNAAMTEAYAWLMFGLGWIFIGIGAIIYALRQPKVPKAA